MSETELIALRYPNRRLAERLAQLWEEGLAALPIDPTLAPGAVDALLAAFRPGRFEDENGTRQLPGGVSVSGEVALVLPTSGSGGPPKGVELSHTALRWSARAVNARLGPDAYGRWLCCLPLAHVAGIGILMRSLEAGTEPVIHNRFDIAAIFAERRATLISLVPTTLQRLLKAGVDLSQYRAVLVGGAPAPEGLIEGALASAIPVIRTYGMTETCGGCVYDGLPLEGVQVRIEGKDLIALKGPMIMHRYRLDPELTGATLAGGWLQTSDRGRWDGKGRLEVLGRADDVIITGGEKVSAGAVARHLLAHPGVADAAVAGIPDAGWGELVGALIVPAGPQAPTLEQLRAFVKQRASPALAPRKIVLVPSIPRTGTGKIRLDQVRELLS